MSAFLRSGYVSKLDSGWEASNSGIISNSTAGAQLTIGFGQSYTNTLRPAGYNLNLTVGSGFIVFKFANISASIKTIEIWNDSGKLIRYAETLEDGQY